MTAATMSAADADLQNLPVEKIDRNPDNPRLIFRQGELEQLMDSISTYGVQVPVSVYKDGRRFVLIDGERRWRCASKLGLRTIPALLQPKPTPLQNLLLMFNIHALREQWDLLTIALKLQPVMDLIHEEKGVPPTERQVAARTGLTRAVIRRCKYLLDLPDRYRTIILRELDKPKPQQKFTEDFFIEMERSLKTVERSMPELIQDEREKDQIRQVLIEKYRNDIIPSRIHFRKIARIARAERVSGERSVAQEALRKLFSRNDYSAEKAYEESVSEAYLERDLSTRIAYLVSHLEEVDPEELDDELRASLVRLIDRVQRLLEGGR